MFSRLPTTAESSDSAYLGTIVVEPTFLHRVSWHSVILTMVRCVNFGSLPSHGTIVLLFGTNMVCNFSTELLGVNLNLLCTTMVVALGN